MQKPYTTYQLEVLLYANDSTVKANEHLVSHASRMLFGIICNPNVVHFNRRFVLIANDFWILLSSLCTCISRIACLPLLRSRSLRFVSALRSYVRLIRLSVCLSAWARSVSAYKQSIDLWSVTFFFLNETGRSIVQIKIEKFEMIHIEATHQNTTQSVWPGSFYYWFHTLFCWHKIISFQIFACCCYCSEYNYRSSLKIAIRQFYYINFPSKLCLACLGLSRCVCACVRVSTFQIK